MLGNTSPENQEISQGPRDTLISISREALILSASLLEYCQCFLREDVFLIFAIGSVWGNTVPRDSIETYTPGSRECIGEYDLCRSCHSISPLLPVDTKKYIPTVR